MKRLFWPTPVALALALVVPAVAIGDSPGVGASSTSGSTTVVVGGTDLPVVELHRYVRPGAIYPSVLGGVLSAPSGAKPETIVRGFLDTHPDASHGVPSSAFVRTKLRTLDDGWALQLQQTYRGLDVLGATVAVRLDSDGRVRWFASDATPVPTGLSVTPTLSKRDAVRAMLRDRPGYPADVPEVAKLAKLAVYGRPGRSPFLVYEVRLPRNLATMETLRGWVDANTGAIVTVTNMAREDANHTAHVYEYNPVTTPATMITSLDSLAPGATELLGPDVEVNNCIDEGMCRMVSFGGMSFEVFSCTYRPDAVVNMSGNFEDYVVPTLDTEPEDNFAEVQMYYHTDKAYAAFRVWAEDPTFNLNLSPITAVANFRRPSAPGGFPTCTMGVPPAGATLEPYDNALFMPMGTFGGGFPPDDWIVFGQGTTVDFSYDGDVVYHEFGHAVMYTVSGIAGTGFTPDNSGLDPSPGGMNEGYPDYFSSVITGDPEVGEYAGSAFMTGVPSGAIRSLLNTNVCPDDLIGESHEDSLPWTAGLWAARNALAGGDRPAFDNAVFLAMDMLSQFGSFELASAMTLLEVAAAIGMPQHDLVETELTSRGLVDCNDRIIAMDIAEEKELLILSGDGQSLIPAPVQFQLDLPNGATEITVTIATSQSGGFGFGGPSAPDIKLLMNPGPDAIAWTWGAIGVHNAVFSADVPIAPDMSGTGTITGNFLPGTYTLQLVNGGATWYVLGVQLYASGTPVGGGTDSGVIGTDAGAGTDSGMDPDDPGGCGCRVGASSEPKGSLPALLGLGYLAALVLRRRRSR